jgi:subfamily B ATP-binding cassette protein MsbA
MPQKEIIAALKIANAYEFVKELPLGIHTNIGDSGNKLSGGQKTTFVDSEQY